MMYIIYMYMYIFYYMYTAAQVNSLKNVKHCETNNVYIIQYYIMIALCI